MAHDDATGRRVGGVVQHGGDAQGGLVICPVCSGRGYVGCEVAWVAPDGSTGGADPEIEPCLSCGGTGQVVDGLRTPQQELDDPFHLR